MLYTFFWIYNFESIEDGFCWWKLTTNMLLNHVYQITERKNKQKIDFWTVKEELPSIVRSAVLKYVLFFKLNFSFNWLGYSKEHIARNHLWYLVQCVILFAWIVLKFVVVIVLYIYFIIFMLFCLLLLNCYFHAQFCNKIMKCNYLLIISNFHKSIFLWLQKLFLLQ